jgi:hypothetical protein
MQAPGEAEYQHGPQPSLGQAGEKVPGAPIEALENATSSTFELST